MTGSVVLKYVNILGSPTASDETTDNRHKADITCLQYQASVIQALPAISMKNRSWKINSRTHN